MTSRAKPNLRQIIFIILALVFILSGIFLILYYTESRTAQKNIELLRETVAESDENGRESDDTDAYGVSAKYSGLYLQNPDFAGWITIPNTAVDYPVMYNADDWMFYMDNDFDRKSSSCGLPFFDIDCPPQADATNMIIYAHNMRDGSMFAALLDYKDKAFYDEHKIISLDTLYDSRTYEVFAAYEASSDDESELAYNTFINTYDCTVFDRYVEEAKQRTPYDTGITPEYGDELLTLSTCAYNERNGRMVVAARRIMSGDELIEKAVSLPGLEETEEYIRETARKARYEELMN